ncbi:MAG: Hpt domain-containing protein, partial [Spirochaetia bacterium]
MEELQQLSDAIRQYEDGDLLAVAEIRETAETLQKSVEDEKVAQILEKIVKTSEEVVLQGSSEENLHQLQDLGSSLVSSASSLSLASEEDTQEEAQGLSKDPKKSLKQGKKQAQGQSKTPAAVDLVEVLIEDSEILSSFLVEAHDHLDDIEERILDLEKSYDEQTVHDIFRSMHTIKGVSSFIGLSKIKGFSHRLETVLNSMR